ncbi:MAG: hypothetical protein WCS73_04120 [Lentisphaeria bacterium]
MAEELQALLDKINEDGLKKTETERDALLSQARVEAAALIKDAKKKSADIIKTAKSEAELLAEKANQALRQASRDMLLGLRSELEKRVSGAVKVLLQENIDTAGWASLLSSVCTAYLKQDGNEDDLTVLVPEKQLDEIEKMVRQSLAKDLQAHCELAPSAKLSSGFRVEIKGSDVMYDFSDKALMGAIAEFVSPHIAAIITAKDEK